MNIFLGSSNEAKGTMIKVGRWLKKAGHTPVQWNSRGVFRAGEDVFSELIRLSTEVDGGIFIFAGDDKTWTRGRRVESIRDNVLLEYALFVGSLGRDSASCVKVGNADIPTDMQGMHLVCLPSTRATKNVAKKYRDAECNVIDWAKKLRPVFLKGLGFDLARFVSERQKAPVSALLGNIADRLIRKNTTSQISAVCGDKRKYGKPYYKIQFDWVKHAPKRKPRLLRRIFIQSRAKQFCNGFPRAEAEGIVKHSAQKTNTVQFRWVCEDDERLSGTFSNNLGFAVFGKSWLVHWGLKAGFVYEHGKGPKDHGIRRLLMERFEDLWDNASHFDPTLLGKLRVATAKKKGKKKRVVGKRGGKYRSKRKAGGRTQP